MSDTDLVERLRALAGDMIYEDIEYIKAADLLMKEAAAALASRDAIIEGLRAALATFVRPEDEAMEGILWDGLPDDATGSITIKLGYIRQARRALSAASSKEEGK